jgi:hypothetical protein
VQNSSQPFNKSVLTDIKHCQINITTTIKIKGRKLPQNPYKNQEKYDEKPKLKGSQNKKNSTEARVTTPRHAYRGTHKELVQGRK